MKNRQKLLTEEQWELVGPLFPEPKRRRDNRGRVPNRACLEGILWILQTGAAWRFNGGYPLDSGSRNIWYVGAQAEEFPRD